MLWYTNAKSCRCSGTLQRASTHQRKLRLSGALNRTNALHESLGVAIPRIAPLTATETKDDNGQGKRHQEHRKPKDAKKKNERRKEKERRRTTGHDHDKPRIDEGNETTKGPAVGAHIGYN